MYTYKGTNKDLTCRGFQYEEGKEYKTDKAQVCECGFHGCEYPLDCFIYYAPAKSRYFKVEQSGEIDKDHNDTKIASTKIKIGAEIDIKGLIKATFEYVKERCINEQTGGDSSALIGGDYSALKGGDYSALKGGDYSALIGGDYSALKGGDYIALKGGDSSALKGGRGSALTGGLGSALIGGRGSALKGGVCSALIGGRGSALKGGAGSALIGGAGSALIGGDYSALKGDDYITLKGGDSSALIGGDYSALTGGGYSVIYGGDDAIVRGGLHSVLAIQYWKNGEFKGIKFKEVDGEKIKVNTYYRLDKAGRFIKAEQEA